MATMKAINENLPRFDKIRRDYWLHGWAGIWTARIGYLDAAFADLDENGECIDITIYSGPGMAPEHYYAEQHPRTVVDITPIMEEILTASEYQDYTAKAFRRHILREIQDAIHTQLNK